MIESLDTASLPLRGVHVIEASAGTGKTFTLANIYVRLLIDARERVPYTVEQILVVTFTVAATEELRARIRDRIGDAVRALDDPDACDTSLQRILGPHRDQQHTRERLELARQSMDQAAIFTIHGFCERVLRELAFESGARFEAESSATDKDLVLAASEAWWRTHITPMPHETFTRLPVSLRTPVELQGRLHTVLADPAARLLPAPAGDDEALYRAAEAVWQGFALEWERDGEAWHEALRVAVAEGRLSRDQSKHYGDANLSACLAAGQNLAAAERLPVQLDPHFHRLGKRAVDAALRKNKVPPEHPLAEMVEALIEKHAAWLKNWAVALQHSALHEISRDSTARKQVAGLRTFDDLLLDVYCALDGDRAAVVAERIRARFPFALVDEFQDTDRVQYTIFDRLYGAGRGEGALYLIGDPKQSIYRFRGADIEVYLRALDKADARHRLSVNWRSTSRLINALNTLYAQNPAPFGESGIGYHAVGAAGLADEHALKIGGQPEPPLRFDFVSFEGEKLPAIGDSRWALAEACARRVGWLLGDRRVKLGERAVQAADIAVLVRTHAEAELVRQVLKARGIDSAMQSRDSVGQSPEARDVLALIGAMLRPGDAGSLSRALVSPLASFSASELLDARDDTGRWQSIEDRVEQCRAQFRQSGPLAMVLRFMHGFQTTQRMLRSAPAQQRGVERVLGNYLHLAERLQDAWQRNPDPAGVLKVAQAWHAGELEDDSLQLRLESDEALVQIVTLHKAKGLQYPVVFLPFVADSSGHSNRSRDFVAFNEKGEPRVDVGSDRMGARLESLARAEADEAMRLLYVGLTRAELACWIGVAHNKNAAASSLFRLLGVAPDKKSAVEAQKNLQNRLGALSTSCPDILVEDALDVDSAGESLGAARAFSGEARNAARKVSASWRIGSYSALARGATHTAERPDHDAVDTAQHLPTAQFLDSPFAFPRGAVPGTVVHAVFERVDFRDCEGAVLLDTATQQLRAHAMDEAWAPALAVIVGNTVGCELPLCGIALSALARADRLDELGFHFPVNRLDAEQLVSTLQDGGVMQAEESLQFERLQGYMTGFIDLVFRHRGRWYIADYKSNHLGNSVADYSPSAMGLAMRQHRYDLQYLIYSVALQRYLRNRLPDFDAERDFGGVLYLFVRGMQAGRAPESDAAAPGVFGVRPAQDLLDALDRLFAGDGDA